MFVEYIKFFQVTILIGTQCYELEKYVNIILNIYFLLNDTAFEFFEETRKTKFSSFF